VTLSFETEEVVDDIRCGLADETALLLQASGRAARTGT
jgi:hypothetical protein